MTSLMSALLAASVERGKELNGGSCIVREAGAGIVRLTSLPSSTNA